MPTIKDALAIIERLTKSEQESLKLILTSVGSATNSIVSGTRKNLDTWKTYIDCIMNGLSDRKAADICEIHRNRNLSKRPPISLEA